MDGRSLRRLAAATLGMMAFVFAYASHAPAKTPSKPALTSVTASCAGDTISGKARFAAPGKVRLALVTKRSAKATFRTTGKTRLVKAVRAGSYRFAFDISRLNAYAFRIDASKSIRSKTMLAASCGPGHEIPEAPFALLLPIALLLTIGVPTLVRRRRPQTLGT